MILVILSLSYEILLKLKLDYRYTFFKKLKHCRYFFHLTAVSDLVDAAGRTIYGMESSQISLLFYLTYVSGAGGIKNLIEAGEFTGQEMKIQVNTS